MDPLTRLREALSDRYEVEREIGAGGMATVYLARDIKHHRQVALKLLSPELGAVLGPERFLTEIRVTANLQHPNLLPLFDSGEAEGQLYYVMPYVDGESLRTRLDRERQLPVAEAVRIGTAIASALDYAHRHGVVHRDLKPENILLQEGQPLVADFGIALAVSNAGGARVTQTGLSLGTPHYMSPEQATGERQIDARSDIYSLGALIYEMLTGEPPHTGSTVQAIIARVLTDVPRDVRISRPSIPEHVAGAVRQALEKIPADRFENAREFGEALQGQRTVSASATGFRQHGAGISLSDSRRIPWMIAAALGVVALGSLAFAVKARSALTSGRANDGVTRFALELPGDELPEAGVAISPDGRLIVYSTRLGDSIALFARSLGDVNPRQIAGTRSAASPFFSPDGKWLGFYSDGKLRKIPVEGGTATELVAARSAPFAFWAADGRIYLNRGAIAGGRLGLSWMDAGGGPIVTLTTSDSLKGVAHASPYLLPDRKTLLFRSMGRGGSEDDFLAIGSVTSGEYTVLPVLCARLVGYVKSHAICSDIGGSVMAIPLDLRGRKVAGSAIPIESGISGPAALSASGNLIFSTSTRLASLDLIQDGKGTPLLDERLNFAFPRLSPDGSTVAVRLANNIEPGNVGLVNIANRRLSRLTIDGAENLEWSGDGTHLFFAKPSRGDGRLWWFDPDRSSNLASIEIALPVPLSFTGSYALSPNGRDVIIGVGSGRNENDLYWLSLENPGKPPLPWIQSPFVESQPRFSPDGRWVAYLSNETARNEVYVAPFPGPGARAQVSTKGGREPVWSRDGRRLYYRTLSGMESADIIAGPRVSVGTTRTFEAPPFTAPGSQANYAVTADGKFIAPQWVQSETPLLFVYLNWLSEVRNKLTR